MRIFYPRWIFLPLFLLLCTGHLSTPLAQSVDEFILIDASTDSDIGSLTDGDVIDLSVVGSSLNVRANASGPVESVRFGLDQNDNYQTESVAPYALAGDQNGDYTSWTPSTGAHTLTATPYTEDDASGTEGASLTVSFDVVSGDGNDSCEGSDGDGSVSIHGSPKKWHVLTLGFDGPHADETEESTYRDYRLRVSFTHTGSGTTHEVPGYFAADGNAANTGATCGTTWQVHFTPDQAGEWTYETSFREGPDVAIDTSDQPGSPGLLDGLSGSFTVDPTDKVPSSGEANSDFRATGRPVYDGEHYMQLPETDARFVSVGPGSPENFLGYDEFDQTTDQGGSFLHSYEAHASDWSAEDPTWEGGDAEAAKGKGIIGALNYLASNGQNTIYALLNNYNGDGEDVWPWTSYEARTTFDASKLEQWRTVFEHAYRKGIQLHLLLNETENEGMFAGDNPMGVERKLYYREMVARFGHLAVTWNIGEEHGHGSNTSTEEQRQAWMEYLSSIEAFGNPIAIHTWPNNSEREEVYSPLLGEPYFEGPSFQISIGNVNDEVNNWRSESASADKKWLLHFDEHGGGSRGGKYGGWDTYPTHERKNSLWASLMAGAARYSHYVWYDASQNGWGGNDLDLEDFRIHADLWDWMRHAKEFFSALPLAEMTPDNSLGADFGFHKPNDTYVFYWEDASTLGTLDLSDAPETFTAQWFNPRSGQFEDVGSIEGGSAEVSVPPVPNEPSADWVLKLTAQNDNIPVELTSFKAVRDGADLQLYWRTASEANNAGFEVQKKIDDRFTRIGFVEGAGTTTQPQDYTYPLSDVQPGPYTFRLKQVDLDGTFEYSREVEVHVRPLRDVEITAVHPNPIVDHGTFSITVQRRQQVTMDLFDVLGRKVKTVFHGSLPAGVRRVLSISGRGLTSGSYFLQIRGEDFRKTHKVILLR